MDPSSEYSDLKAEGALFYPRSVNTFKSGDIIVFSKKLHKVIECKVYPPPKRGHGRTMILAIDLVSGETLHEFFAFNQEIDCPFVKKEECELIFADKNSGFCTFNTEKGVKDDLKLPEKADWLDSFWNEYGKKKKILVNFVSAAGQEVIEGFQLDE